jgi:hypothetical protein
MKQRDRARAKRCGWATVKHVAEEYGRIRGTAAVHPSVLTRFGKFA